MKRTDWSPNQYTEDCLLDSRDVSTIRTLGVIGMGDVGITMVIGLMLYGRDQFDELLLVDRHDANQQRLSHELAQIRSQATTFPRIRFVEPNDLVVADMVLFVASVSVPKVGEAVTDARLVQFGSNWALLHDYATRFVSLGYHGFFGVVSDPVDYLATHLVTKLGIDPTRVMGFGQGVMAARAAYYGGDTVRMFGPHGRGLFVANDVTAYDEKLSLELSEQTLQENILIRSFGFKPYIAPALSSAAIAITDMVAGRFHYSSQFVGKIFWGERYRFTTDGLLLKALSNPTLREQVSTTYRKVVESYESASHSIESDRSTP